MSGLHKLYSNRIFYIHIIMCIIFLKFIWISFRVHTEMVEFKKSNTGKMTILTSSNRRRSWVWAGGWVAGEKLH